MVQALNSNNEGDATQKGNKIVRKDEKGKLRGRETCGHLLFLKNDKVEGVERLSKK